MITSPHNEKLKEIRRLNGRRRDREKAGRFVAEGEDLLAAAATAGWDAVDLLVADVDVTPELLAGVSELGSGTRALGIYESRWLDAPVGPLCVYLHGVGDPGNVGTILRSAEAFGASCVALGPGSADPYSPKAVRASMGAIFTVPVVRATPDRLPGAKIGLDADVRCLSTSTMSRYRDTELTILLGAEREGLPDEVSGVCDEILRIPIANHSLNVAMAATIALYELNRGEQDAVSPSASRRMPSA